jgi:hypothetical protein
VEFTEAQIIALLDKVEPAMRADFLRMVGILRSDNKLETIAQLLETGRFDEALRLLPEASGIMGSSWVQSYVLSGTTASKWLMDNANIIVSFDQTNTRAIAAMQENNLRLVQSFTEGQRQSSTQALIDGIRRGANPREIARDFRDSIGLAPSQQRAVSNYRRFLETSDSQALQRALRDKRFDSTVRRALRGEITLTPSQIDKMVSRYSNRMVKHRAEVIARTEALRSVHEGNEELFRQAIESGQLDIANVIREWFTAGDERVRSSHTTMNGQVQPFGEPFISGKGSILRYPGDPRAPAGEVIQCRCAVGTRIILPKEVSAMAFV